MFTHKRHSRRASAKMLVLMVATVMLVVGIVGTSLAWLMASTDPITNVFTFGQIEITLEETEGSQQPNGDRSFPLTPGQTIDKDPKVTVVAKSENCWLFVKVEEANDLATFIDYTVDAGWTELTGVAGVYWRSVTKSNNDQVFSVLTDDQVTVKSTVTSQMLESITDAPTLTFTAYAIQTADAFADAAAAWEEIEDALNNN